MVKVESISKEGCDRYLITIPTLEKTNKVRNALMLKFELKTCIYVVKSINKKTGWDIFISNGLGGYPSDEHHRLALKFAKNIMKKL